MRASGSTSSPRASRTLSSKAGVGDTAFDLGIQIEYYSGMSRAIIDHRPQIVVDQYHTLHHLFVLGDLFTELPESPPPKTLRITSLEVSLLIHEWIGFMICDYVGAYSAAARTLRWIYESAIASTVALIDGSLLLGKPIKHPLTEHQLRKWLGKYDHRQATFPRKKALQAIGLSLKDQARYDQLYSTLCKYSHLSAKHFAYAGPVPDLTLDLKHFDAVSRHAYRTMDLALYCIIKAIISQWDVKDFLHSYLDWFSAGSDNAVRREKFPLTLSTLKSI